MLSLATLKEREDEVQALRLQLAQRASSSSNQLELENRLRALTDSLLNKQSQIEVLSTERNSLVIQLEAEKRKVCT